MVIIKDRKPHESVIKEIICKNCGVTLEYVPIDVKEEHGRDYSGGSDGCKYINCPNCMKRVIIKSW